MTDSPALLDADLIKTATTLASRLKDIQTARREQLNDAISVSRDREREVQDFRDLLIGQVDQLATSMKSGVVTAFNEFIKDEALHREQLVAERDLLDTTPQGRAATNTYIAPVRNDDDAEREDEAA